MSQSERIQYTVTGYNFKEISSRKGSIEYQLMDAFGNERTVTAMAKLNFFQKVSSVRPIYHRELPLIQALARTKLNDSVVVDFSEFNKDNPRGSMRKSKVSTPSVRVKHTNGDARNNHIYGLGSIIDNKLRLFQLMIISVAGFMALSYLFSKVPSPFS